MALTNEYFRCVKSVSVADEFERSYFNAMLGSVCDNPKYCTYNTPMNIIEGTSGQFDGRRVASQVDSAFQYVNGSPDMNCCQANYARGLGEYSRWACFVQENTVYLNSLMQGKIFVTVCDCKVQINVESDYPLKGNVKVTVQSIDKPLKFDLKVRIPTWTQNAKSDALGNKNIESGKYFSVLKTWKQGDSFDITFDIPVRIIKGERDQSGYSSVFYGSLLFALDEEYSNGINRATVILKSSLIPENVKHSKDFSLSQFNLLAQTQNEKNVTLIDFASAGKVKKDAKTKPYYSWIKVE